MKADKESWCAKVPLMAHIKCPYGYSEGKKGVLTSVAKDDDLKELLVFDLFKGVFLHALDTQVLNLA